MVTDSGVLRAVSFLNTTEIRSKIRKTQGTFIPAEKMQLVDIPVVYDTPCW